MNNRAFLVQGKESVLFTLGCRTRVWYRSRTNVRPVHQRESLFSTETSEMRRRSSRKRPGSFTGKVHENPAIWDNVSYSMKTKVNGMVESLKSPLAVPVLFALQLDAQATRKSSPPPQARVERYGSRAAVLFVSYSDQNSVKIPLKFRKFNQNSSENSEI